MRKRQYIPTPLFDSQKTPVVLTEYHPQRQRTLRLILAVITFFWALFRMRVRGKLDNSARAAMIRAFLERMGGLWIKFGQLLSLRQDIFSRELCLELSYLQDRATGYHINVLRKTLEEVLNAPIDRVFSEFEEAPFAAASIGQVHRARLRHSRDEVVVKLQKPDARALFTKDLTLIRGLVRFLSLIRFMPYLRWSEMEREIKQVITEELDYRFECTSLERLREGLRAHKVIVPKVYVRLCSAQVLTMERLEGVFMSDYIRALNLDKELKQTRVAAWCAENNVNPKKVADRLLRSTMRQVFEDNIFHGDLHPGNILLFRDSRIGLIDFGSVGTLDNAFKNKYAAYVAAIGTGEYDLAADLMLSMSSTLPNLDLLKVRDEMAVMMRSWAMRANMKHVPYQEKSLSAASNDLGKVTAQYKIEPIWALLKVGRTWTALDASLGYLNPKFNYIKSMRRYQQDAGRRELARGLRFAAELPRRIAHYALFLGPYVREKALSMQAAGGRAAQAFGTLLRFAKFAAIVAIFIAIWTYLGQHHSDAKVEDWLTDSMAFLLGEEAVKARNDVKVIHEEAWLFIIIAMVGVWILLGRLIRIMTTPQVSRD